MSPEWIITNQVADYFDLTSEDILGPKKIRKFSKPRQMCYILFRDLTDMSFPQIGEFFNRDHSTIIKGIEAFESRLDAEEQLARESICNALAEQYNESP